jgi:hypothetical protein
MKYRFKVQAKTVHGDPAVVTALVYRKLPFSEALDTSLLELQQGSISFPNGGEHPVGSSSSGGGGGGGGMPGGWSSTGGSSSSSSSGFSPEQEDIAKWALYQMTQGLQNDGGPGETAEFIRLLNFTSQVVAG